MDGKQFGVGIEAIVLDGMGTCGGTLEEVSIIAKSVLIGGGTYAEVADAIAGTDPSEEI